MANEPTRVDFVNKKVIVEPPPLPVVMPPKREFSPILLFVWGSLSAFALSGIVAFVWNIGLGSWCSLYVFPYVQQHLTHLIILILIALFVRKQWFSKRTTETVDPPPPPVRPRRVPPPDDYPPTAA